MPELKMSNFLNQFANDIQQTGNAVSGFAEKLYNAETYSEVYKLNPTITENAEKQLTTLQDLMNGGDYTLDDNKNPVIGGKTLDQWTGLTTDFYNNQMKLIQSAKTPDARRQLTANLNQTISNLNLKVMDSFNTTRRQAVEGQTTAGLSNLLSSNKPIQDILVEGTNLVGIAVQTGAMSRAKAIPMLQEFKENAISLHVVKNIKDNAISILFNVGEGPKGYAAALAAIANGPDSYTYQGVTVRITEEQQNKALNTVNLLEKSRQTEDGQKLSQLYIDALKAQKDPNFKPAESFDLDAIAKYGNGDTSWIALYKDLTGDSEKKAADNAYVSIYGKATGKTLNESEYTSYINNEKNPVQYRVNVVTAWEEQKGNKTVTAASVMLNNLREVAAGRAPKLDPTTGQPPVLTMQWIKDNAEVLGGQAVSVYGSAVTDQLNKIQESNMMDSKKSIMSGLIQGKYKSEDEVISAVPKGEDASFYVSFYWNTQDRKTATVEKKSAIEASSKLDDLEGKLRDKKLTKDDITAVQNYLKDNSTTLGGYYDNASARLQKLAWALSDSTSSETIGTLESDILKAGGSYDTSIIWKADIPASEKAKLYNLATTTADNAIDRKYTMEQRDLAASERAKSQAGDALIRKIISKYSANEKLKRGGVLETGEEVLTSADLADPNIPLDVVKSFTDQLNRDAAEDSSLTVFKTNYALAKEGKATNEHIWAKGLTLSQSVAIMDANDKATGATTSNELSTRIRNLARQMRGETVEGPILTEEWLKSQKDPDIVSRGSSALISSIDFYADQKKGNAALAVYKQITKGQTTGDAILSNSELDANTAMQLYGVWRNDRDMAKETEKEQNADKLYWGFRAAEKLAKGETLTTEEQTAYDNYGTREKVQAANVSQGVRDKYYSAYDTLDKQKVFSGFSNRVSDLRKSSATGEVDEKAANSLDAELSGNKILDPETVANLRNQVAVAVANSKAVNDDKAARERQKSEWAYTDAARAKQADLEGRQKKAGELLDTFRTMLPSMDEEGKEIFKDAIYNTFADPTEAEAYTHELDILYAAISDKSILSRDKKALDAFDELKRTKTVSGYQQNGPILTEKYIADLFPGETDADLKMRKYYNAQLEGFNQSYAALEVGRKEALTRLSNASRNLFAQLTGIGFDSNSPILSPDMIKEETQFLRPGEDGEWNNALTQFGNAVLARQDAAARATAKVATDAQELAGKKSLGVLKIFKSNIESQADSLASPKTFQLPGVEGQILATPENFMKYLLTHAKELDAAGLLEEAYSLIPSLTPKTSDKRWDSTKTIIDGMKKKGKFPVEMQGYVDQFMKRNPGADENTIAEFNKTLAAGAVKISVAKEWDLRQGVTDQSEEYLKKMYSGEFTMFMGDKDGTFYAAHPEFKNTLETWGIKSLSEINNSLSSLGIKLNYYDPGAKNVNIDILPNGGVQFTVTDSSILKKMGITDKYATFYMGLYNGDALVVRETDTGTKVFVPWEKPSGAKEWGRWVGVDQQRDGAYKVFIKNYSQNQTDTRGGYEEMPKSAQAKKQNPVNLAWGTK